MSERLWHINTWLEANQYQINVGSGLILTLGLTGLSLLMIVIWPNTRLKFLTLWFVLCLDAVMWRWVAAVVSRLAMEIRSPLESVRVKDDA